MTVRTEYGTASFRGLEFEILPTQDTLSRRIVVNRYPFTNQHYNEDLGDNPERFNVSGVLTGENARDKLTAAKRLWLIMGSGVFFEPTENKRHTVTLISVTFDYDPKVVDYIPFTMELIERSDGPYPGIFGGLLGRVNGIADGFISTVSEYYSGIVDGFNQFTDVITGFEVATDFVFDTVRQSVTQNFGTIIGSVVNAEPSPASTTTAQTVSDLFESAATNDAPIEFFSQASEVRVLGTPVEEVQGHLFALTALSYYFEKAADGVDYAGLAEFRARALALKAEIDDVEVKNAIDGLICSLGQATTLIECTPYPGEHHALVASYQLFGDVSKASDILGLSYGVSGAALNRVNYR